MSNAMFSEEAQDQEIELLRRFAAFDLASAIEAIAEKVHKGWAEEKLRQGFSWHIWTSAKDAPDKCTMCYLPEDRHHPDMLPYSKLAEHVKNYDRKMVGMVFKWLEENGWKVVRK